MGVIRKDNTAQVKARQRLAIEQGLLLTAEFIATEVQNRTPVQTGRLKASIKALGVVEQDGKIMRTSVNAGANYAPYVEYGTSKMAPRAMFRRTIDEKSGQFKELFAKIVKSNM